jgi:hypothetical protein
VRSICIISPFWLALASSGCVLLANMSTSHGNRDFIPIHQFYMDRERVPVYSEEQ